MAGLRRAPGFELPELNLLGDDRLAGALAGLDAICHLAGRPGVRDGLAARSTRRATCAPPRPCWPPPPARGVRARAAGLLVLGLRPHARAGWGGRPAAAALALRPLEADARSGWPASAPRRRGSSWWSCATSPSTARASARTWPSRASWPPPSPANPMPLLGDGGQVRDFTYVGDAAEATALALERGRDGAMYNVAGGPPATLAAAFELLGTSWAGPRAGAPACRRA